MFDCEFVAVNHWIPDALAVVDPYTPGGSILHTGDFQDGTSSCLTGG